MTLLLDPDIRDWVVIPLFFIMVIAGMLRHYVGLVLGGGDQKQRIPLVAQRGQNLLAQVSRIRAGGSHYLTTWEWHVRKEHYRKLLLETADAMEEQTEEDEEGNANDPMEAMMTNPLSMMKGNMAFMVQK